MDNQANNNRDGFNDVAHILKKVVKYWYLFIIALLVAFAIAYVANRYTPTVYPIESSILIKGEEEFGISAQTLLYGNDLNSGGPNISNEAILLKAIPLIRNVVKELNFDKIFYSEGNIQIEENYRDAPALVQTGFWKSQISLWAYL